MEQIVCLKTGALITNLQRIDSPKGSVYHGIKATDETFAGFGEAYFSTVLAGVVKGWKCHNRMTLNLVVPVGTIDFYLRTKNGFLSECVRIGVENYSRLTVPPGIWVAFSGVDDGLNLLLNVASISHDPAEADVLPIDYFPLEN